MRVVSRSQRCTSWLCLVLLGIVSLLPARGTLLCLGADGHVGLGLRGGDGASAEHDACPCGHHGAPATRDRSPGDEDSSDPGPHDGDDCRDLLLDVPDPLPTSEAQLRLEKSAPDWALVLRAVDAAVSVPELPLVRGPPPEASEAWRWPSQRLRILSSVVLQL